MKVPQAEKCKDFCQVFKDSRNIDWQETGFDDEPGPKYKILYPQTKAKDYNLPEKLEKAYIAAQRVKNIDPNAFAVLLGRTLDMICIEKNAHGRTLSDKIKNMSEIGIIPQQISQIALGLKDFRNIGAHADLGELSETEIPIVEELINVVLEYVYAAPAMIDRVRKEIDKLKGKQTQQS